jgi:hypothetical protein
MEKNIKFEFKIKDGQLLLNLYVYVDKDEKKIIKYYYPLNKELDIEELIKILRFIGECNDNKK